MLTFEKVTEKNEEDLQNTPNVHHQENNKTPKQEGAGKLDRRLEQRVREGKRRGNTTF